jgi:dCMP deaminase
MRSSYSVSQQENPYCFKDELSVIKGQQMTEYTRSLHAEENALMQAAKQDHALSRGTVLYTTDSPCTLCSKKAYDFGIDKIVYIEEYPGLAVGQTLRSGDKDIQIQRFEGITGEAYFTLFASLLSEKDLITIYS